MIRLLCAMWATAAEVRELRDRCASLATENHRLRTWPHPARADACPLCDGTGAYPTHHLREHP